MRHQILLIHTDAGVGDSEGFVLLVQFQVYPGVEWERLVCVIDKGQMAELIQRVRRVGDEFTKENLGMRIERVDDQLQQLIDFSLKFTFRHRSMSPISKYKTAGMSNPPTDLNGRCPPRKWRRKCPAWIVATPPSTPQKSG